VRAARVRAAEARDAQAWLEMRRALWPEGSADEHAHEIAAFLRGVAPEPLAVLVAEDAAGGPCGFAELSIRAFAEGCETDRVAYVEGWFVAPASRRQGVGRALIEAAQVWARGQGCRELASDTRPDNAASVEAHRASGFEDAGLVRCFRKSL
jgi:aminoglycoside 6'-N-acetyltransferase I